MNNQTNNETFMKKHPRSSLATALLVARSGAGHRPNQPPRHRRHGRVLRCPLPIRRRIAGLAPTNAPATQPEKKPLPKLLDLGAGKCIPCKMMFPVLDELKKEYAGKLEVEFIDVWQNPDAGKQYGIEVIPTQIFYDAHRQGIVPPHRFLCQGRHSRQVEGTRRGVEVRHGTTFHQP